VFSAVVAAGGYDDDDDGDYDDDDDYDDYDDDYDDYDDDYDDPPLPPYCPPDRTSGSRGADCEFSAVWLRGCANCANRH